jgi:hypothetical protein
VRRTVAISLKIPDNSAYTALTALRRIGLELGQVDRREIWQLEDAGVPETVAERVSANAAIFNPNKHRVAVLDHQYPENGEVWISTIGRHDEVREHLGGTGIDGVLHARRCIGWRLRDSHGNPVERATLAAAVEGLLCNPAVEEARYEGDPSA